MSDIQKYDQQMGRLKTAWIALMKNWQNGNHKALLERFLDTESEVAQEFKQHVERQELLGKKLYEAGLEPYDVLHLTARLSMDLESMFGKSLVEEVDKALHDARVERAKANEEAAGAATEALLSKLGIAQQAGRKK